jgi:hypothetical protein
MKDVTAQMQDALPTSFDTTATLNTASGSRTANSFDDVVLAFKEALYGVKVDMDGDEMGHFVDKTVSMLMYA